MKHIFQDFLDSWSVVLLCSTYYFWKQTNFLTKALKRVSSPKTDNSFLCSFVY